ncbi:hypothetical protein CVT24_012702 [Panaeolus cyanescens]|uniref:Uncharacterized protein n=1 Tax=Panaeolus cyanescens TaxID=181874 RepID=A0A409YK38_9AGAR|nr:hypothetical protein CVT24_012702 [Panaeolus cyanescens]
MWDDSQANPEETKVYDQRQKALENEYWHPLIDKGSYAVKFMNTALSAKGILWSFRTDIHQLQALQLQVELVTQHQTLKGTKAAKEMNDKLDMLYVMVRKELVLQRECRAGLAPDEEVEKRYQELWLALNDIRKDMEKLELGVMDRLKVLIKRVYYGGGQFV